MVEKALIIRPAALADLDALDALIEQTRRWVQARWPAQWRSPFDRETLAARVEDGQIFCAHLGGELVGTFRLLSRDPDFWGEHDSDNAHYVHMLIVRRDWSGRGYGAAILRWVERYAAAHGRRFVRLDTLHDNETLIRFYHALGYELFGTRGVHNFRVQLFQKALTPLFPPPQ